MGNWQYASQFHVPISVISTSAASGYPAERVAIIDNHPLIRSWRSTSTSQQDIILDFGSPISAVGWAVLHTNFTSVQLATSPNNSVYTFFPGSPYPITRAENGLYKFFLAYTPTIFRYFLVRIPAQPTTGGHPYFEVGAVVVVAVLTTFIGSPRIDMARTTTRPYLRSGPDDVAAVGLNRTSDEWQMVIPRGQKSTHEDFILLGQQTPILIYENTGVSHEVRLARQMDDITAHIGGTTHSINPRMRELI